MFEDHYYFIFILKTLGQYLKMETLKFIKIDLWAPGAEWGCLLRGPPFRRGQPRWSFACTSRNPHVLVESFNVEAIRVEPFAEQGNLF